MKFSAKIGVSNKERRDIMMNENFANLRKEARKHILEELEDYEGYLYDFHDSAFNSEPYTYDKKCANLALVKMYERVNKAKARRMYADGETIFLSPCKIQPFNEWNKSESINNKGPLWEMCFDDFIREFEYYNCNYPELGKYASFYVRVE